MNACLVRHLLGAHASGPPARGEPWRIRADHVLLGELEGPLAFLGFETLALPRVACEEAVVVLERDPAGPDAADDARWLHAAARRWGARLVRAGAGPAAAVYLRRFAAPGRVLLADEPAALGAGAFGTLVTTGGALEATLALAGLPLPLDPSPVCEVRLVNALRPGASAEDVLAVLRDRLESRAVGAALEFTGPGVAALGVADRIALARLAPRATGARFAVFPVDDRTRAWLRAHGRETDWRRLETGGTGFDAHVELALDDVSPAAAGTGLDATVLRVGPHADDATRVALADALAQVPTAAGVCVVIEPGGRGAERALGAERLAALQRAGVGREGGVGAAEPDRAAGVLVHGGDAGEGTACGAAELLFRARTGRAPRPEDDLALALDESVGAPLDPAEVLEPALESEREAVTLEHGRHHAPPPRPAPWIGTWRAPLLAWSSPREDAAPLLAWGPRLVALRGDAEALATHLMGERGGALAESARAQGGGVVALGRNAGAGDGLDAAARALAVSGVRVVLAGSFAPGARRTFARHGVLPLTWRRPDDAQSVAVGDVLELAGAPEVLQPERALELRDLTTGLRLDFEHGLPEGELDILLAGGWLRWAANAVQTAEV